MSFHLSFELNLWIGIFTFSVLSLCILLSALGFVLYIFYFSAHGKNISTSIKLYSVLSLFFFVLGQLFTHLYIGYVKLPNGVVNETTESFWSIYNSFWSIYNSFWSVGYSFTYLVVHERLRHTFKGTVHRLTKMKSVIFFTLLAAYFAIQQCNTAIWLCFVFDLWDWTQFNFYYHIVLWLRFSIDWLLNIYVIVLFCHKILKLTVIKANRKKGRKGSFQNDNSPKIFGFVLCVCG